MYHYYYHDYYYFSHYHSCYYFFYIISDYYYRYDYIISIIIIININISIIITTVIINFIILLLFLHHYFIPFHTHYLSLLFNWFITVQSYSNDANIIFTKIICVTIKWIKNLHSDIRVHRFFFIRILFIRITSLEIVKKLRIS